MRWFITNDESNGRTIWRGAAPIWSHASVAFESSVQPGAHGAPGGCESARIASENWGEKWVVDMLWPTAVGPSGAQCAPEMGQIAEVQPPLRLALIEAPRKGE